MMVKAVISNLCIFCCPKPTSEGKSGAAHVQDTQYSYNFNHVGAHFSEHAGEHEDEDQYGEDYEVSRILLIMQILPLALVPL